MFGKLFVLVVAWFLFSVAVFLLGDKLIPIGSPSDPEYVANYIKVAGSGLTLVSAIAAVVLQTLLTGGQETEKQKAIVRVQAYSGLYGAMRGYYRALSELERSQFNSAAVQASETAMKAAEGTLAFLEDAPTAAWEDFWQEARAVSEEAPKITAPDTLALLWGRHVKSLAAYMATVRQHAQG
jgi:hypothetical protein